MTSAQLNRPNPRSGRGWFIVLGAAVLGVFAFCGIVAAAAGSKDPQDTGGVSRTGALAMAQSTAPALTADPSPAAVTAPPTTTAVPTTAPPATTAPVATTPPAAKAPTTKPPATRAPTKAPTKPAGNCNPNYSPCVPNDPVDVDCKGGGGNGPSYVQGPVTVIGTDVYDLDRDGDGIGCE